MRNFAPNSMQIKHEQAFECLSKNFQTKIHNGHNFANCLFVYPAQCNFSGTKYSLNWINKVQNNALNEITNQNSVNWYVLLDAACFVPTNDLNLNKYKPDFVTISFYKIFGYPTGLGALIVRKNSEHLLKKRYFGGGTVLMALSSENIMIPRPKLHQK